MGMCSTILSVWKLWHRAFSSVATLRHMFSQKWFWISLHLRSSVYVSKLWIWYKPEVMLWDFQGWNTKDDTASIHLCWVAHSQNLPTMLKVETPSRWSNPETQTRFHWLSVLITQHLSGQPSVDTAPDLGSPPKWLKLQTSWNECQEGPQYPSWISGFQNLWYSVRHW